MTDNSIVKKPWGEYQVLTEWTSENNKTLYKVKKIVVKPNSKLSLQSHNFRNELWIIVEGEATIICGEEELKLKPKEQIFISEKTKHRISNFSNSDVVFIEVQNGTYLGEDDIIRYEDVYGRV